jgi:TetR/AcrR family transcriptional regulator, lmrAB and yxaGH operons repressor
MATEGTSAGTRSRLLDATVDLLRAKGPAATGTAEILDLAAAPRGSFYYHFPAGKDQLVGEAVARAAAATAAAVEDALRRDGLTLPERIEYLIEQIAVEQLELDFRLGCAVGATALESGSLTPSLRLAVEDGFTTWTTALAEHFAAEGIRADRAAALADGVVAAMEGATMLARARRDVTPIHNVARMARLMVDAALHQD